MAEIRQLKPLAERCEAAEGKVQQVEAEAEALREMVANLTEGKVVLTTKVCLNHHIFCLIYFEMFCCVCNILVFISLYVVSHYWKF